MNDLKVSDALWDRMRPLLPVVQRRRRPGRKQMDDRACLNGILFVLATGIDWERLPQQLGYGSGMTCWRRLREGQAAACVTGCTRCCWLSCAPRAGCKHHVLTRCNRDTAGGHLTGGNRNDVTQLVPLLDAVPPIRGRAGRPRRKPSMLVADRGYNHEKYRRPLRARGIRPMIARRGVAHGSGLGRWRWPVERTLGTPGRPPRGHPPTRLLPDQLAVPATLIQLGILTL